MDDTALNNNRNFQFCEEEIVAASIIAHAEELDVISFRYFSTVHFDLVALIELAYLLQFCDKPFVELLCLLVVTTLYIGIHDE